jgi:hypothetical protein
MHIENNYIFISFLYSGRVLQSESAFAESSAGEDVLLA